jgi:peptidoglycan/LPS O-acetylase OafA/YrhL
VPEVVGKIIMSMAFPKSLSVALHFLRGLSAQAVVIGHGLNFAGIGYAVRPPNFPYIQNIGVLVFFFMSGMVICQSIQSNAQKGGYGFFQFFTDRAIRFAITIIPCLVVIFLLDQLSVRDPNFSIKLENAISIPNFLGNILMLQTHPLFSIEPFGTGRPLWSVAVEWWTYMFFGFLILFWRSKPIEVLLLLPVFALSFPVIMTGFLSGRGLVLVWMLGAISCYMINRLPKISGRFNWFITLCSFVSILPYFYYHMLTMQKSYSLPGNLSVSFMLFFALYFISHAKFDDKNLFSRSSRLVANYSFTLYCVHYSVFTMLQFAAGLRGVALALAGLFVSNILAFAIAAVTEMRYKQYRDWIKAKLSRTTSRADLREAQ